jgi:hypothetical protein
MNCHHERSEGSAFLSPLETLSRAIGFPHSSDKSSQVGFMLSNQYHPLRAVETLDLLLSFNSVTDIPESLPVHETVDSVALRETLYLPRFMLSHSPLNVIRHTGVNASRFASHDVRLEVPIAGHARYPCCNAVRTKADPSLRS